MNEELQKLYNVVKEKGFYTKSFDDFQSKYSTPEAQKNLYDVVTKKELYTKDFNSFSSKYFSSTEKKNPIQTGSQKPLVETQAPIQESAQPIQQVQTPTAQPKVEAPTQEAYAPPGLNLGSLPSQSASSTSQLEGSTSDSEKKNPVDVHSHLDNFKAQNGLNKRIDLTPFQEHRNSYTSQRAQVEQEEAQFKQDNPLHIEPIVDASGGLSQGIALQEDMDKMAEIESFGPLAAAERHNAVVEAGEKHLSGGVNVDNAWKSMSGEGGANEYVNNERIDKSEEIDYEAINEHLQVAREKDLDQGKRKYRDDLIKEAKNSGDAKKYFNDFAFSVITKGASDEDLTMLDLNEDIKEAKALMAVEPENVKNRIKYQQLLNKRKEVGGVSKDIWLDENGNVVGKEESSEFATETFKEELDYLAKNFQGSDQEKLAERILDLESERQHLAKKIKGFTEEAEKNEGAYGDEYDYGFFASPDSNKSSIGKALEEVNAQLAATKKYYITEQDPSKTKGNFFDSFADYFVEKIGFPEGAVKTGQEDVQDLLSATSDLGIARQKDKDRAEGTIAEQAGEITAQLAEVVGEFYVSGGVLNMSKVPTMYGKLTSGVAALGDKYAKVKKVTDATAKTLEKIAPYVEQGLKFEGAGMNFTSGVIEEGVERAFSKVLIEKLTQQGFLGKAKKITAKSIAIGTSETASAMWENGGEIEKKELVTNYLLGVVFGLLPGDLSGRGEFEKKVIEYKTSDPDIISVQETLKQINEARESGDKAQVDALESIYSELREKTIAEASTSEKASVEILEDESGETSYTDKDGKFYSEKEVLEADEELASNIIAKNPSEAVKKAFAKEEQAEAEQEVVEVPKDTFASKVSKEVEDVSDVLEGGEKITLGDTDVILIENKDSIVIESIQTKEGKTGKGSAKRALMDLTREADKQGKRLELNPVPKDETISQEGLESLYANQGFIKQEDGTMVREPLTQEIKDNLPTEGQEEFAAAKEKEIIDAEEKAKSDEEKAYAEQDPTVRADNIVGDENRNDLDEIKRTFDELDEFVDADETFVEKDSFEESLLTQMGGITFDPKIIDDIDKVDHKEARRNWTRASHKKNGESNNTRALDDIVQEWNESNPGNQVTIADAVEFIQMNPKGVPKLTARQKEMRRVYRNLTGKSIHNHGPDVKLKKEYRREDEAEKEDVAEDEVEGKKERSVSKGVLDSKDISKEVKEGLSEDAKRYIPKKNTVTQSEAKAIVEIKGAEQSRRDVLNRNNQMSIPVRVEMSRILIDEYNKTGDVESAVELIEEVSKMATEMGQGIQALALWSKISADGMFKSHESRVRKAKEDSKARKKILYESVKKGYKKGTKNASDKATKKAKETILGGKPDLTKAFGMSKSQLESKLEAARAKFKKAKGGSASSSLIGMNSEQIEALGEIGFYLFAKGLVNFKNWAAQMKRETGLEEEAFADIWNNQKVKSGKTLNDLSKITELEDLVSSHYQSEKESDLSKAIVDAFGVESEFANKLAKEIDKEFKKIAKAERAKAIKKQNGGITSKRTAKIAEEVSEKDNMSEEEIEDAIAKEFGIESLPPEVLTELKAIEKDREALPEGFLKNLKTKEMVKTIDQESKIPFVDKFWSVWYASVLSGHETQALNVIANTMNIGLESFVSEAQKVMFEGDKKALLNIFTGSFLVKPFLGKGKFKGFDEFNEILKTGTSPREIKDKLRQDSGDVLERMTFKGGKYNPVNYYKYVGRFMSAVDSMANLTSQDFARKEYAERQAKEEGLKGKKFDDRVKELLNDSEVEYAAARLEAEKDIDTLERQTGKKFSEKQKERLNRIRTSEIMDASMDQEIEQRAKDFGAFVTFNYDPQGFVGIVAKSLGRLADLSPGKSGKLILPFTRVVANVLNQQIDYTPYGYLRAYGRNLGGAIPSSTPFGFHDTASAKDQLDRQKKIVKATIGTTMITMFALLASDDEEGQSWFDITGKGPSNYKMKSQLYSQGWKPYHIKVGETWINYQYTPLALVFSAIGNWKDAEKYNELGEKDAMTKAVYALQSSAKGVMDMSFLTGAAGLMNALSTAGDPEKQSEKLMKSIARTGTSFIPNALKQLDNNLYDNTIYSPKTVGASILSQIPIARHHLGLKPKLNIFGQNVRKEGSRFHSFTTKDPLFLLMADKEVFAPGTSAEKKFSNGEQMTQEQYYEWVKLSGNKAYDFLLNKIDKLKEMSQEELQKEIEIVFREERKYATYDIEDKKTKNN